MSELAGLLACRAWRRRFLAPQGPRGGRTTIRIDRAQSSDPSREHAETESACPRPSPQIRIMPSWVWHGMAGQHGPSGLPLLIVHNSAIGDKPSAVRPDTCDAVRPSWQWYTRCAVQP